jgi:hypothetical protein
LLKTEFEFGGSLVVYKNTVLFTEEMAVLIELAVRERAPSMSFHGNEVGAYMGRASEDAARRETVAMMMVDPWTMMKDY